MSSYAGNGFDLIFGGFYNDFSFERVPNGSQPFVFGATGEADRIGFSVCRLNGTPCVRAPVFTRELASNRTISGFVDATFAVADNIDIFGGLRYDDFKNRTQIGLNTLTPTQSFTITDNAVSGRIGASYQPSSNSNLYASYARGYKPPAVGTNPLGILFELEAEKSDAFEIGAKMDMNGIQLAANAFYNKLKNFQGQANVADPASGQIISTPLNYDEVVSKGLEFTAFGNLSRSLSFNFGYQFNIVKYPDNFLGDDGQDIGGRQFLLAPKHKITLSGEYKQPISSNLEAFFNGNVIYKSAVLMTSRADPRYVYPGHEIINVGMGIRDQDGRWNASIYVRNLTKEREPLGLLPTAFAGQLDGGISSRPVGGLTARVVGVRAGFAF
ncbi:TonB-dependent receptor domain-containing protein [Sphingobium sp. MK2]|uniref:TonB-dependent receptor n=1 Tax=Sphingobium sp. MK2 TaxID=3116540 RepID=UPI0032E36760